MAKSIRLFSRHDRLLRHHPSPGGTWGETKTTMRKITADDFRLIDSNGRIRDLAREDAEERSWRYSVDGATDADEATERAHSAGMPLSWCVVFRD
jgi:hypothetical protein